VRAARNSASGWRPRRGLPRRVAAIEPVIDSATRSLLVRGVVPNPQGCSRRGPRPPSSSRFRRRRHPDTVPRARAVHQGHSVFVVRDGRAAEQPVTIGLRTAERVQILAGSRPATRCSRATCSGCARASPSASTARRTEAGHDALRDLHPPAVLAIVLSLVIVLFGVVSLPLLESASTGRRPAGRLGQHQLPGAAARWWTTRSPSRSSKRSTASPACG